MIRTTLISIAEPGQALLGEFKAELGVTDSNYDGHIRNCLLRALTEVQDAADTSLIDCTIKVTDTEVEDGRVRLYQNVEGLVSVMVDGVAVSGTQVKGNMALVSGSDAEITYTTKAVEGDVMRLKPVVFRYGRALFEGLDTSTLNRILSEC